MFVSFNQYAKHIGVSKEYISKLKKQGRLDKAIVFDPVSGKNKIDLEKADGLLKGSLKLSQEDDEVVNYELGTDLSYDEIKRLKLYYELQSEKLDYDIKIGKYMLCEDVKNSAYRSGSILRDRLLALPQSLAPKIVGKQSIFDIKNIITDGLSKTITEFVQDYESE